jgi:hypothetical protein
MSWRKNSEVFSSISALGDIIGIWKKGIRIKQ